MTTLETIELRVPDFDLGTQAQIEKANSIRIYFIKSLIDRGFATEDIQKLLDGRVVAKWWLDNCNKLTVAKFTTYLSTIDKMSAKKGSLEAFVAHTKDIFQHQLTESENYKIMSQPMFKYTP